MMITVMAEETLEGLEERGGRSLAQNNFYSSPKLIGDSGMGAQLGGMCQRRFLIKAPPNFEHFTFTF